MTDYPRKTTVRVRSRKLKLLARCFEIWGIRNVNVTSKTSMEVRVGAFLTDFPGCTKYEKYKIRKIQNTNLKDSKVEVGLRRPVSKIYLLVQSLTKQ
jgi:hypothetical protein